MASRKCDCTTKRVGSKKAATTRTEASTDNAKTTSRTTSKKTSRTKNCN
ncbi:MAG: hypothetical protein ACI4PF_07020 [Christensenellales bacterium]